MTKKNNVSDALSYAGLTKILLDSQEHNCDTKLICIEDLTKLNETSPISVLNSQLAATRTLQEIIRRRYGVCDEEYRYRLGDSVVRLSAKEFAHSAIYQDTVNAIKQVTADLNKMKELTAEAIFSRSVQRRTSGYISQHSIEVKSYYWTATFKISLRYLDTSDGDFKFETEVCFEFLQLAYNGAQPWSIVTGAVALARCYMDALLYIPLMRNTGGLKKV